MIVVLGKIESEVGSVGEIKSLVGKIGSEVEGRVTGDGTNKGTEETPIGIKTISSTSELEEATSETGLKVSENGKEVSSNITLRETKVFLVRGS